MNNMDESKQLCVLKAFVRDLFKQKLFVVYRDDTVRHLARKHGLISLRAMERPCGDTSNCLCALIYNEAAFENGVALCDVVADWVRDTPEVE